MSKYDLNYIKQIRNKIQNSDKVNIVVGAGDVWYGHEWIATNKEELNVYNEEDWEFFFKNKPIDNVLSEHVWEHLSDIETAVANVCIHRHLKIGGNFRVAVPDGRFPSSDYLNAVKPNGSGSGSDEHKILYTYETMLQKLERALFRVEMREYWNENHEFIAKEWDISNGIISRSKKYDERNKDGILRYTSIIADAVK